MMLSPDPRPTGPGTVAHGALLLADISGYTAFLQGVAEAHRDIVIEAATPPVAYALMSSLLDRIVTDLEPRFRLAKFEGDAVFAVGPPEAASLDGTDVLATIRACHAGFSERLAEAKSIWTCTCDGCIRVAGLGLKFVLHHGDYVVQRIAGQEELLGSDVNTAHRLLKNHAVGLIGPRPYALLTDAAILALDIPTADMLPITETYDQIPPVAAHVLPLA